uniref:Uncharacterized protein n=1 Tax=Arundo donax TaxID=35708 RepID=A0A0A8XV14_ARUDO
MSSVFELHAWDCSSIEYLTLQI